jgi:hypothetical protein
MSRLVDIDEVIRIAKDTFPPEDVQRVAWVLCHTPTAYDVEKVVAELEKQAEQYSRRALELVDKSTEAGIHNKGKACSYEHAIEIVKRGGAE